MQPISSLSLQHCTYFCKYLDNEHELCTMSMCSSFANTFHRPVRITFHRYFISHENYFMAFHTFNPMKAISTAFVLFHRLVKNFIFISTITCISYITKLIFMAFSYPKNTHTLGYGYDTSFKASFYHCI